jgi:RimJ/RimL family protein N-acetyltransferase
MPAPPFGFLEGARAMPLSQDVLAPTQREFSVPILQTERLVLRAPGPPDAKSIARLAGDRRIAVNTARIPHPFGVDDAHQFVAAVNRRAGEATFLITLDGAVIGACGIDPREGGPEIGYWLGVPYWSEGYATEAARAVIDYAFDALQHEALQAGARVSNPASRRVLEKCGFQWTGVELTRIRAINSAAPSDRFRLDRRLWGSLRAWGQVSRVA